MELKNKNILIISPFFFPELISTGKFNANIAIALRDKGFNVTILCSHPLYPKWKPEKSNKQISGIKTIRGGANIFYTKHTIIRRVVLEIWFAFFIFKNIFKYQKNQDIIIPIFPPSLAFYAILPYINKKIKKVGIVHDLQNIYSSKKKDPLNKIISFFIKKIESKIFRACDKLIFLSNDMKDTANKIYNLSKEKLYVQYPFVIQINNKETNDLRDILSNNKINIVYSGALGEKQNPIKLYKFFDFASKKLENSCFYFFSQGQVFEKLKNNNSNANIKFYNLVRKENIEELYARSTIQIIPQLPGTSKGSLPSKLPNLLASKCEILVITDKDSEIERIFKTHNFQKVITSWDNDIILNAIQEILIKQQQNKNNRINLAKEIFNIDSMIEKIVL